MKNATSASVLVNTVGNEKGKGVIHLGDWKSAESAEATEAMMATAASSATFEPLEWRKGEKTSYWKSDGLLNWTAAWTAETDKIDRQMKRRTQWKQQAALERQKKHVHASSIDDDLWHWKATKRARQVSRRKRLKRMARSEEAKWGWWPVRWRTTQLLTDQSAPACMPHCLFPRPVRRVTALGGARRGPQQLQSYKCDRFVASAVAQATRSGAVEWVSTLPPFQLEARAEGEGALQLLQRSSTIMSDDQVHSATAHHSVLQVWLVMMNRHALQEKHVGKVWRCFEKWREWTAGHLRALRTSQWTRGSETKYGQWALRKTIHLWQKRCHAGQNVQRRDSMNAQSKGLSSAFV